jgi:RNase P subunit RPR2
MVIDEPDQDWMHMIKIFLENQPPLDDNAKVEHIERKSKQYHLIDVMKCISREEDIQLLRDIHSGICESHSS